MNPAEQQLYDLLEEIEQRCNPYRNSKECFDFYLDCLMLVSDKMPPIAAEAMDLLMQYRATRAAPVLLRICWYPLRVWRFGRMRVRLWKYLNNYYKGRPDSIPEASIIRACIFPLFVLEEPTRDFAMNFEYFLEFLNYVEPRYDEHEALLRKHFSHCLKTGQGTS